MCYCYIFLYPECYQKKGLHGGTCGGVQEGMHYKSRGRERSRSRLKTETGRGSDANMSASSNAWIKSFRHLTEAKQSRNDKLVSGSEEERWSSEGGCAENFSIKDPFLRERAFSSVIVFTINYS